MQCTQVAKRRISRRRRCRTRTQTRTRSWLIHSAYGYVRRTLLAENVKQELNRFMAQGVVDSTCSRSINKQQQQRQLTARINVKLSASQRTNNKAQKRFN